MNEILIVEDSPTQAEQLRHVLEQHGYRITAAVNGEEAITAARARQPDLIISDVLMPIMDGYAMCTALRRDPELKSIPVIILTTLSDPQDVVRAIEAGVDYYLTKPYQEEALLARVTAALAAPQNGGTGEAPTELPTAANNQRVVNLLLSTYENAVRQNRDLIVARDELRSLNDRLGQLVEERTAELVRKSEEMNAMTQHLWQAAKLATMGELAASIAHELNNPLATVSLRIEALLAQSLADEPRRQSLDIVQKELDRMARLVAELLQFSRRSQPEISTVDLCDVVDKTLDLITYHFRKTNICVRKEFAPDLREIFGDRQQLQQVFLNLFSNAADAMPQGGTLTVRVSLGAARTCVVAEVSDTGTGIAPEVLPKIMDPFFTTKPEGKGTGLGLPICRRIVQEHHGSLRVTSKVGEGTKVTIELPITGGIAKPVAE